LQELDEIGSLAGGEAQSEEAVVMVDHVGQGREASVVVEAARQVGPKTLERSRAVPPVRRPHRLEVVDSDLAGSVHVPSGLGVEGWYVAPGAVGLAVEEELAALGGRAVETSARSRRRGERQLVEVKRGELGGDEVFVVADVSESVGGGHGELPRVVEPGIVEGPLAVHLEVGDQ